jgi:regulator of RNase E activity RraA
VIARASTATLTTIFMRQGIRNVWMPLKPLFPWQSTKMVGPALTIRSVPGRNDLQGIAY